MNTTLSAGKEAQVAEKGRGVFTIPSSDSSMDLMLISSPANALSTWTPYYYLCLAGFMEKHGISVSIVNPHFSTDEKNIQYILDQIKLHNPRYIGLPCFVTDYQVVHDLAVRIKEITSVPLLVGNAQPSVSPEDFLYEGSPFDIVAKGEAEETVREIITLPGDFDSLKKISGIAFFDGKSIVTTDKRPLMNLADLGKPAYHLMDMEWYSRPSKYMVRRLATRCAVVYTGRGCPFDCNFCASNVVWNTNDRSAGNQSVRMRPLDDVMDELELLQNKYGFDFFYIGDDTFGLVDRIMVDFCDAYMKRGLKMLWAAETRAPCIKNPETVRKLKEAGCIQLDFGVESGSPKILDLVQKKIKVEHIDKAFELCNQFGMRTFANLLLNMPRENDEDLQMTHDLLERIRPTYTSIGLTQPYPGTPLYDDLPEKIDKSEYHLLSRILPIERFRFAEHKHDLRKLLFSWQVKYDQYPFFEKSMITAEWPYWKKILTSKHRVDYFRYFLKEFTRTALYSIFVRTPLRDLWFQYKSRGTATNRTLVRQTSPELEAS